MSFRARVSIYGVLMLLARPLAAQDFSTPAGTGQGPAFPPVTVCGQQTAPLAQPPQDSGPVVLYIAPCFEAQGNASVIESQTYLYYIHLRASQPSQGLWVPWDDTS